MNKSVAYFGHTVKTNVIKKAQKIPLSIGHKRNNLIR